MSENLPHVVVKASSEVHQVQPPVNCSAAEVESSLNGTKIIAFQDIPSPLVVSQFSLHTDSALQSEYQTSML